MPRNRPIFLQILTFLLQKSREIGRFFHKFWLFFRENPAKSANFSTNLPLKILRNFAFFSVKYQEPCHKVFTISYPLNHQLVWMQSDLGSHQTFPWPTKEILCQCWDQDARVLWFFPLRWQFPVAWSLRNFHEWHGWWQMLSGELVRIGAWCPVEGKTTYFHLNPYISIHTEICSLHNSKLRCQHTGRHWQLLSVESIIWACLNPPIVHYMWRG